MRSRSAGSVARGPAPAPPWMAMAYMAALSITRVAVHGDLPPPARIACAAEHAGTVEIHGDVATPVQGNHATLAAGAAQFHLHHLVYRLRETHAPILHQRAHVVRNHLAYVVLALARSGDRAGVIAGVSARADERRVADAAAVLVGQTAGGGRGREIPGAVERHRADGAHAQQRTGQRDERRGLACGARRCGTPRLFEFLLPRRGAKVAARHQRHPLLERELLGAAGDQE